MLAMPNVLSDWSRAPVDPTTAAVTTLPNQPTLTNVPAHAAIIPSTAFHELPSSARKTTYVFNVDAGTDIVTGDVLVAAYDVLTNAPWPHDYPDFPGAPGLENTIWVVRFHLESTPGLASYRALYVEKVQLGGPASPF